MSMKGKHRALAAPGAGLVLAVAVMSWLLWPRMPADFDADAWFDAIARGDTAYVEAELARGVLPEVRRADGWSSLRVAASAGHHGIVRALLEDGAEPTPAQDEPGPPLLHLAALRGDPVLAGQLLAAGADPVARDARGRDAFDLAAARGDIVMMAELVAARPGFAGRARDWWNGRSANAPKTAVRAWHYLLGRLAETGRPRDEALARADASYRKAGRLVAATYRRLQLYADARSPLYDPAAAQALANEFRGRGDPERRWLRRHAEAGDSLARFLLGLQSRVPRGDDLRRQRRGIGTVIALAGQGMVLAQFELAAHTDRYYPDATGKQRDELRRKWLDAAADQGHPLALRARGWAHARAGRTDAALSGLRRAADRGLRRLYAEVATALEHGRRGLPEDPSRALEWYGLAVEAGDRAAMDHLAEAYELGKLGLTPDLREAARYRARAGDGRSSAADRRFWRRVLASAIGTRDEELLALSLARLGPGDAAVREAWLLAARVGAKPLLDSFIAAGLDIDTLHLGRTALIGAAAAGRADTLRWLLARGADPNLAGAQDSPLTAAAAAGHCDLIGPLLDQGAAIDARVAGRSALLAAVARGRQACAESLLARGANPRLTDRRGRDILALARARGDHGLAMWLLEQPGLHLSPAAREAARQRLVQEQRAAERLARWRRGQLLVRLDASGRPLKQQAGAYADRPWACVRDEMSGLTWAIKDDSDGPNDKDLRFQYSRDADGHCGRVACSVEAYIAWLRRHRVCGSAEWRVPTQRELATLGHAQLAGGFPYWPGFAVWTQDRGKLAITWASGLLGKHTVAIGIPTAAQVLPVHGRLQPVPDAPHVRFTTITIEGGGVTLQPPGP